MKKIRVADIIKLGIEAGLFLTLSYFIWMKFYSVIVYSYSHEFREMNMVAVAKRFSQGINPYSYQSLNFSEIPEVTNMYGFLTPLLISPWIRIFGGRYTTANFLKAWSFYEPDRHNGSCVCSNIQSLSYS